MTRAKFTVSNKTVVDYGTAKSTSIELWPVTGGSEENKAFFASTPTGKITLSVVNQAAADDFEAGKDYYVDFTKA